MKLCACGKYKVWNPNGSMRSVANHQLLNIERSVDDSFGDRNPWHVRQKVPVIFEVQSVLRTEQNLDHSDTSDCDATLHDQGLETVTNYGKSYASEGAFVDQVLCHSLLPGRLDGPSVGFSQIAHPFNQLPSFVLRLDFRQRAVDGFSR
jgi:hypothetical protein